jgi:hypothetical protein
MGGALMAKVTNNIDEIAARYAATLGGDGYNNLCTEVRGRADLQDRINYDRTHGLGETEVCHTIVDQAIKAAAAATFYTGTVKNDALSIADAVRKQFTVFKYTAGQLKLEDKGSQHGL